MSSIAGWLKKPIQDLSPRWLLVGLGLFSIYCFVGCYACDRWQHRSGQNLAKIGFGYGVLIDAIESHGQYRVCDVHYPGVCFSAHRLPLIPYFLIATKHLVGDDIGRIAALKCGLSAAMIAAAFLIVIRRSRVSRLMILLGICMVLGMPRWAMNFFEISVEEAYNIPALALLFSILWFVPPPGDRLKQIFFGISLGCVLGLLLFLKSSMLYWCFAVPILLFLRNRDWRVAGISGGLVAVTLIGLGLFNAKVSGRFTVSSSWEGWNLYKGNSANSLKYYPHYNLDNLDYLGLVVADRKLVDEWDHNSYFKQRAIDFIRQNPATFAKLVAIKTWVFFFEWRETGYGLDEKPRENVLYSIQEGMMLLFRGVLWWALILACWRLFKAFSTWQLCWHSASFVIFLFLYSGFHVIGFTYERHVMPIVLPTVLFLFWAYGKSHSRSENRSDSSQLGT
jgi:hypothetical protein